jgi:hypothetical protein
MVVGAEDSTDKAVGEVVRTGIAGDGPDRLDLPKIEVGQQRFVDDEIADATVSRRVRNIEHIAAAMKEQLSRLWLPVQPPRHHAGVEDQHQLSGRRRRGLCDFDVQSFLADRHPAEIHRRGCSFEPPAAHLPVSLLPALQRDLLLGGVGMGGNGQRPGVSQRWSSPAGNG